LRPAEIILSTAKTPVISFTVILIL